MSVAFTRQAPSARYQDLLAQYRQMHAQGEQHQGLPAAETFAGRSLLRHAEAIKRMIDRHGARTLLDYGAGKGEQYTRFRVKLADGRVYASVPAYWGVDSVTCFDPAYPPFSTLPPGQFDAVVNTDVLEHCPEQDIPWILREIFGYARRFVYGNVACYPARKRLANGENAHCTIQSPVWWQTQLETIAREFPNIRFQFALDVPSQTPQTGLQSVVLQG